MHRRGRGFWERTVAAHARSGLSQAEFADRHDLSVVTLGGWIRRLRAEREHGDEPAPILPVRVIASTAPTARWLDEPAGGAVEVELASGVRLRFTASVAAEYVARLARALG